MQEILVIGATGAMGRPVVSHLLQSPRWKVRVLTREPSCEEAEALRAIDPARVTVLQGSPADAASVARAVEGVYGVFCNTNFFSTLSVEREVEEGIAALEAARKARVSHFVYSSLDSLIGLSHGELPVPHFDAKAAVGAYIDRRRSDDYMRRPMPGFSGDAWYLESTTVLVTAPYYENVQSFFRPFPMPLSDGRQGFVWMTPFGDSRWPMVALDDIGWFTAMIFADPERWRGRTLPIASQVLSGAEIAATFSEVTGIPSEYRPMSMTDYERLDIPFKHDFVNMMKCINAHGLPRDMRRLRELHPGLLGFAAWLQKSGWRGEEQTFMKSARQPRR